MDPDWNAVVQRATAGVPSAQYQVGMQHASQAQYAQSREWLARASAAGHADAAAWLGLHALYGYGAPADFPVALGELEAAEARGSPEAAYRLALLGWGDRLVARDPVRMAQRIVAAARADHASALRGLALVHARAAPGDPERERAGESCLRRAAALGDAAALYLLAARFAHHRDPRRRAESRALYAAAAARGQARAAARGDGPAAGKPFNAPPPSDWPEPLFDAGAPAPAAQRHCQRPLIETVDGFFAEEECEYLIALAEPFQQRSVTVSEDGRMAPHPSRSSSDAPLFGPREDFGARWLQARMLDWLGAPLARGEHLVVLRYRPGEEYRPHVDWLPAGARGNSTDAAQPGQRVDTVFAYLAEVEAGGETDFPRARVRVAPRRGRIVHFGNLHPDGRPDEDTLHAGLPVRAGEKWLATIWTRERPYRDY
jgi:hypothetical protein